LPPLQSRNLSFSSRSIYESLIVSLSYGIIQLKPLCRLTKAWNYSSLMRNSLTSLFAFGP
jgi:hypothetical protein